MRDSFRPILSTFQDGSIIKIVAVAFYLLLKRFIDSLSGPNVSMVVLLVLFDLVTGIAAALKKKKRVSSRLWYRTPLKIGNYCILLSLGHLTANMMLLSWLDPILLLLIVMTEVLSILENVSILQPRLIPKSISRRIGKLKMDRDLY
jgi:phage-related holin